LAWLVLIKIDSFDLVFENNKEMYIDTIENPNNPNEIKIKITIMLESFLNYINVIRGQNIITQCQKDTIKSNIILLRNELNSLVFEYSTDDDFVDKVCEMIVTFNSLI
jgi:hypothetical protein